MVSNGTWGLGAAETPCAGKDVFGRQADDTARVTRSFAGYGTPFLSPFFRSRRPCSVLFLPMTTFVAAEPTAASPMRLTPCGKSRTSTLAKPRVSVVFRTSKFRPPFQVSVPHGTRRLEPRGPVRVSAAEPGRSRSSRSGWPSGSATRQPPPRLVQAEVRARRHALDAGRRHRDPRRRLDASCSRTRR